MQGCLLQSSVAFCKPERGVSRNSKGSFVLRAANQHLGQRKSLCLPYKKSSRPYSVSSLAHLPFGTLNEAYHPSSNIAGIEKCIQATKSILNGQRTKFLRLLDHFMRPHETEMQIHTVWGSTLYFPLAKDPNNRCLSQTSCWLVSCKFYIMRSPMEKKTSTTCFWLEN